VFRIQLQDMLCRVEKMRGHKSQRLFITTHRTEFSDVLSHDTCQELKCRWWQCRRILWSRTNKNWLQAHVLWNATGTEQLLASLFIYKRTIHFYRWWHFPSRPLATLSNDHRRRKKVNYFTSSGYFMYHQKLSSFCLQRTSFARI
jgi:hypothetical protein